MSHFIRDDKAVDRIVEALEGIEETLEANLPAIEIDLNLIAHSLNEIANFLRPKKKARLTYSIGGSMPGNTISGVVGNTATPHFSEADASGNPVAPIGPVIYASDNTAVVTVDANTGVATLVSAGTANVSALDQGNNLTDTVAFTVSGGAPAVATSASLSYTLNASRRR